MKKKVYIVSLLLLICASVYAKNNMINVVSIEQATRKKQDSTLYKLYHKADSLYNSENYALALKVILEVVDETNDNELEFLAKYLAGKIWYKTRAYKKTINYLKPYFLELNSRLKESDVNEEKKTGISFRLLKCNFQIGKSYQRLYEIEFQSKDSILKKRYSDSTVFFYEKVLKSSSKLVEAMGYKASTYNNLSGLYTRSGKYQLAEKYALEAIRMFKIYGEKSDVALVYNLLFNIYFSKFKYKESQDFLFKGLKAIEKTKNENVDEIRAALYLNISYVKHKLKEDSAYIYQERAWNLYDTIKDRETQKRIADIYADRNFEKGKQEGVFQEELKRQKTERNLWIIGLSSFIIIIFLAFMLNQNRLRQKNLSLELSQKETESQIQVLNANLEGQETERKRISQELHDGILSKLFGSRIGLGYLELDSDKETQGQYQKYLEELQNIEKEIREVSHKLSSDISLSETSLLNAINQLLKEKSKLGDFDFQLKIDDAFSWKELDGVLEMNLFRILQESLQNVIKHAKAKNVNVSFGAKSNVLVVAVEDDGVGFDIKKKSKGIGLKNIRSRIEKLKGTMRVSSETGKGTVLELKIPLV
ncbi:ATP-binding protein [Pseudotenacibaculum haliotis]|uniref:Oxygen sensor histidine kinase NreB n=1 Tax=Pseudotenacibaculum haliotis TaxID=1862138 RepID=A0ABW5LQ86_9FLAO